MHITYHGLSCIKIIAKTSGRGSDDVTIILSPYDKKTGLRPLQSKADIVIVPQETPLFSGVDGLRGDPIILNMPGEYAVKGVNVVSLDVPADPRGGIDRGRASISVIDVENMKIAYLGGLGGEPEPDTIDLLSGSDIVFIPVGDEGGLDGKTAEVLLRKIEPKIIVPIHFKSGNIDIEGLRTIDDFCTNIGNCPKDSLEKLSIKSSDKDEITPMSITILSVV